MWKEIMKDKEAVLFDLDGTLVDSMWVWKQIDIDYFAQHNLVMPSSYQRDIEGLSFYETAVYTREMFVPHVSVDEIIADWNKMAYDQYANAVRAKEGVLEFLDHLREHGIRLGIATSNSRLLCMAALASNGIETLFDSILTGEECVAGKPCPDVYLRSAEALDATPSSCVVFEDLSKGIMAGKAAGMLTVAVHDDYSADQWEEKCRLADHSIMSYREITDELCHSCQ